MKLVNLNLFMTILMIACERKNFILGTNLLLTDLNHRNVTLEKTLENFIRNGMRETKQDKDEPEFLQDQNKVVNNSSLVKVINSTKYKQNPINKLKTSTPDSTSEDALDSKNEHIKIANATTSLLDKLSTRVDNSLDNLRKFNLDLERKIKSFEMRNLNNINNSINITSTSGKINLKKNLNMNNNNNPNSNFPLKTYKKKKYSKEKEKDDENSFMFYNSLSLIMLSMLAGGLVGIVFILYFSFKKENELDK